MNSFAKGYTEYDLVLTIKEASMTYKKKFGVPPLISDISHILIDLHNVSRTVSQLNKMIYNNESLLNMARNNAFGICPSRAPKWFDLLTPEEQKRITVINMKEHREREPVSQDDVISKITVNDNGVTISNPIDHMDQRTKDSIKSECKEIMKLRRNAKMAPQNAQRIAMGVMRQRIDDAYINTVEKSNFKLRIERLEQILKIESPKKRLK